MKNDFDYTSIRSVAILTPVLFLVAGLKYFVLYIDIRPGYINLEPSLFMTGNTLALFCFFLEYLLTVALFVNLYRLADVTIWWKAAEVMLLIHMMLSLVARIVEWQLYYVEVSFVAIVWAIAVTTLPALFVLLGVVFLIQGFVPLYAKMRGNNSERKVILLVQRLWAAAAGLLISVAAFSQVAFTALNQPPVLFMKWLAIGITVLFFAASVPASLCIRNFCQEYYLYRYNKG